VLEDDDDETVVTSNINEGYNDGDDFGMQDMPLTTHHEKPVQMTKMVTPVIPPNSRWAKSAWNSIIQQQDLQDLPNVGTIFNTTRMKNAVEYAISDSGAKGHFLVEGATLANLKIAANLITITLPNS